VAKLVAAKLVKDVLSGKRGKKELGGRLRRILESIGSDCAETYK
jgi:hypothetical protein